MCTRLRTPVDKEGKHDVCVDFDAFKKCEYSRGWVLVTCVYWESALQPDGLSNGKKFNLANCWARESLEVSCQLGLTLLPMTAGV